MLCLEVRLVMWWVGSSCVVGEVIWLMMMRCVCGVSVLVKSCMILLLEVSRGRVMVWMVVLKWCVRCLVFIVMVL